MAKKQSLSSSHRKTSSMKAASMKASSIKVRRVQCDGSWELVHPRCAKDRADDIQEVAAMIEAGEFEIAQDELIWLLSGCHDFIKAHYLLGELAVTDGDLHLARGHFGIAFSLGDKAAQTTRGVFHCERDANQSWLASGKGLLHCLKKINEHAQFEEVLNKMLHYNPQDPLGLKNLADSPIKCSDENK